MLDEDSSQATMDLTERQPLLSGTTLSGVCCMSCWEFVDGKLPEGGLTGSGVLIVPMLMLGDKSRSQLRWLNVWDEKEKLDFSPTARNSRNLSFVMFTSAGSVTFTMLLVPGKTTAASWHNCPGE